MKTCIIAGCSHAAGSEIDGTEDSVYNRSMSFGNLLAKKLGLEPINIAITGASNSCIARSLIEWFDQNSSDNLSTVLVAWTDSSRLEIPSTRRYPYRQSNQSADWFTDSCRDYMRVNMGYPGGDIEERAVVPYYQKFIAQEITWIELYNLQLILQSEFLLKSKKIEFLMCATQPIFAEATEHIKFYKDLIDNRHFYELGQQGFYWKYRNLGFKNKNAKYLHHDEEPHELYAQELYEKIINMRR